MECSKPQFIILITAIVVAATSVQSQAQQNYIQGPTGILEFYVGGTTPGPNPDEYPVYSYSGYASLNGTLDVKLRPGGFIPAPGDSFPFLTAAGGVTGEFTTEILPTLPDGAWELTYDPESVVLTVVPEPTTLALLTLAGASLLARRRGKSSRRAASLRMADSTRHYGGLDHPN